MSNAYQLNYLIHTESESEIDQLIAEADYDILGDLLHVAVQELSVNTARKILARQPDVMKLLTVKGFSKTPTPAHFYLCDDFDYMFMDDEEDFKEKRLAMLQLLLAHNADPNWQGKNGGALDAAIQSANEALIKCLLAAGADINKTHKGSALNVAIKSINDEQKRKGILQLLLESGADVNGDAQHRPILTAARENQIGTIQFLLDAGADLYAVNDAGKNLLDIAAERQQKSIIDFCSSLNWHLSDDQKILMECTIASENLNFPAIYEVSKRFPEHYLEHKHMIGFSYAATQVKDHKLAIEWVQKAIERELNAVAVNRYIAAWTYASNFSEAIACFEQYKYQIKLEDLDNFAQANLLVAALQTSNPLIDEILEAIQACESTKDGAGLLYFNAACVCSLRNQLDQCFRFLVASRLNNFKTSSIDFDSDLDNMREKTEFYVLQDWKNLPANFYRAYSNDKELWYFQDHLYEIDFAEQRCDEIELDANNSAVEKAMAVCYALRDYEQQGNNPLSRPSAALNSLCEDITTAMMELLDSDNGDQYKGIGFEWSLGADPLSCQWWAQGILYQDQNDDDDDERQIWDDFKIPFTSYFWCDEPMYQALTESIKSITAEMFKDREFFIQLGRYSDEKEPIKLGCGSD